MALGIHRKHLLRPVSVVCVLVSCDFLIAEEQVQHRLAGRQALQNWRLLFQMEEGIADELGLMFGDCGSIYFYIREEDLQARNFDRVWLILQCG